MSRWRAPGIGLGPGERPDALDQAWAALLAGRRHERLQALGRATRHTPVFATSTMVASRMCAADLLDGGDADTIPSGAATAPRVVAAFEALRPDGPYDGEDRANVSMTSSLQHLVADERLARPDEPRTPCDLEAAG